MSGVPSSSAYVDYGCRAITMRRASTVLALSRALRDLIMAPHVENRCSTAADDAGMLKYR